MEDITEESVFNWSELRVTRIAPATTLVIGTALLTQIIVLSSIAIIMGIAVVTMCALMVELFVLTIVATILERGFINLEDLGTLMEIIGTVSITILTLVLALLGGNQNEEKSHTFHGSPIAAFKLS